MITRRKCLLAIEELYWAVQPGQADPMIYIKDTLEERVSVRYVKNYPDVSRIKKAILNGPQHKSNLISWDVNTLIQSINDKLEFDAYVGWSWVDEKTLLISYKFESIVIRFDRYTVADAIGGLTDTMDRYFSLPLARLIKEEATSC